MHIKGTGVGLAILAVLTVGLATSANAQVLYGSIVGSVQDQSGAVIPNATVTLTSSQTGLTREATSDGGGRYSFVNVLPGTYEVKVSATGFKPVSRTDVVATANTVTRIDLNLELGQVTEQITVAAEGTMLQTDKSDTHATITTAEVQGLPLPGYRNYQSLMNLVPGATPTTFQNSPTDTPNRALSTHVNGTNRNNNTTRIDGAASVNLWLPHHAGYVVPEEMVEQVNVTTSAADAEQGLAGGSAVTVITKSGTNDLHGSAFEFHDDQHLKARNFFQKAGVDKPLGIYNNFGGTLGGPIVKNKLFFFFSYDGTRQRNGAVGTYSVPAADLRSGDFSRVSTIIYDPNTGNPDGSGRTPFAGNKIPAGRLSPISQKILSFIPAPNQSGDQSNFFASATPIFDRDYVDTKINFNRNERHVIWGKYGRMSALVGGSGVFGVAGGPAPGSSPGLGNTIIHVGSIGHTFTFSPTVLLDGVFGVQRMDQNVKGTDFGTNYGEQLGIPGLNGPDVRQSGFPNVEISGYEQTGVPGWMPLFRVEENFTTSHNITWIKGAHELRFGFDGVLYRMTHWQPELGAGPRGYIFSGGGPTGLAPGSPTHYNALATFLLGVDTNVQKSIQYILMTPREWQFGWYARDRWQATRNLTLNLGLRYEYFPLMTRATGKGIERLDPITNQVFLGGRGDVPRDVGISVSKKLFAPRIGIAYRLGDKTVIRTGYGLNYDPLPFSRPLRGFYPLTVNFNFVAPNGFAPLRNLSEGIPPVVGPDLSTGIVDLPAVADMRSPYAGQLHRGYIQSWNFTVERRLPADVVMSAAYVGTETTHQMADLDANAAPPGTGPNGRPYAPLFGRKIATNMWDGYLSANYHSLQLAANRQFSRGLMLKGAYTWSKAINMTDDDGWAGVNWNYPTVFSRNRAPAGYDRTHIFQLGWVYELPAGKGKQFANSGPASWILGNWQVNGIVAAYTGTPFTVTAPGSALNTPSSLQTANQVGPVKKLGEVGPGTRWYDISAFQAPTGAAVFGNMGRNVLRSPGTFNMDLSVFRDFPINERFKLSFRTEAFNILNHPQFGSTGENGGSGFASNDVSNSNFLRVTGASRERQIRFGLRLGF